MTAYLEKAVHSVCCAVLSWEFVKSFVCPSFSFDIEGRMWDAIVLIPDHCLSILFKSKGISIFLKHGGAKINTLETTKICIQYL